MGLFKKKCQRCNENETSDNPLTELYFSKNKLHLKCLVETWIEKKEDFFQIKCVNCDNELKLKNNESFYPIFFCPNCNYEIDGNYFDNYHLKSKGFDDCLKSIVDKREVRFVDLINPSTQTQYDENRNFTQRNFNFESGMDKVIQISYSDKREVGVKLFFSKDDFSIFSRNYTENKTDNFIRLIIDISRKTNSALISGGNYDFNDSFDKGYTLFVMFKYFDKKLLSQISEILRNKKFGCLPTNYSIHAHLAEDEPTIESAKEILSEITDKIKFNLSNNSNITSKSKINN